jgi:hypothetical protein
MFGLERKSIPAALLRRAGLGTRWLRALPGSTADELLATARWATGKTPQQNLMSHSSEFMPGGSPYWPSQEAVDRQFGMYRRLFGWWRAQGIQARTLAEFSREYRTQKDFTP